MFNIENNGIAKISVKGEHVTLRAITLCTNTDKHDTIVREARLNMFRGCIPEVCGHIFMLTDKVSEKASVFIVPTPDCVMPSITVQDGTAEIKTHGYPVSVGTCDAGEEERLCRYWYTMQYTPTALHAMSNTWGDRNGRTRVNHDFIKREIDSGADLGLDVVQIDDGWQTGIPNNFDDDGLCVDTNDFWRLKDDIFPDGLEPLSEYAHERGVELGLWFAPDSRGVFKSYSRDLSVLKHAYTEWGIKYFKLDMTRLVSLEYCERMLDLLDDVLAFGAESVELDVTADKRLGFLSAAPYGTLFVENRYTAWANYYPHRTLRNLWALSKFIPASKFQFELVNPELSTDKYSSDDPFRPELYDIDYLFASVMLSNPLFWMETQFLSDRCRARLKRIVSLWREYREAFARADVYPIGDEPSGASMTGFIADLGEECHLILFREATDKKEASYTLSREIDSAEVISANTSTEHNVRGNEITVSFGKKRSYVWLKVKLK
jgi:alpha-galactosidase